jgi:glycosyltransferase EpsD
MLNFHLPYLELLKAKGCGIDVAVNGHKKIDFVDNQLFIPFNRKPLHWNNLVSFWKIRKLIKRNNYKIIHTHTPMCSVVTRLASIGYRKRGPVIIYTAHGFHFFKGSSIISWLSYFPVEVFLSIFTDVIITMNEEDFGILNKIKIFLV